MAEEDGVARGSVSDTASKDERRRRKRRRRRVLLAAIAGVLVGFYAFVMLRGPADYTGELAQLLPARTSALVALHDFDGMRKHLAQTQLWTELSASVDLGALLMTSEDWRKYQEDRDSVEGKAKAALAREFLRRYFSRRFVVALARLDGCDEAALLVLAQTDLGFAEKLAELVATLYPDLELATERYRNVPLYAYDAEESKRSFTFVRFGKTVVLSLRSNERDYLRRIIDYRCDAPGETLFSTADFQAVWRTPARRRGVLAFARPETLWIDLYSRSDFKIRKYLSDAKRNRLRRAFAWVRYLQATLTTEKGIEAQLLLQPAESTSPPVRIEPPGHALTLLETVPAGCLGFVVLRSGNLAETLARILNVHRLWSDEADDPAALNRAVERLNAMLGLDINRELAPALGDELALVVHNVQLPTIFVSSLLARAVDIEAARAAMERLMKIHRDRYSDPDQAWRVPDAFKATPDFQPIDSTLFGFLGAAWMGEYCMWGLNPDSYRALKQRLDGTTASITQNPILRDLELPLDEPLDAVAFVDLEEIGRRVEGIVAVLTVVSKSVRRHAAKYGKIINVVKILRGVGLYVRHTPDRWTAVLKIPTR